MGLIGEFFQYVTGVGAPRSAGSDNDGEQDEVSHRDTFSLSRDEIREWVSLAHVSALEDQNHVLLVRETIDHARHGTGRISLHHLDRELKHLMYTGKKVKGKTLKINSVAYHQLLELFEEKFAKR